MMIHCTKKLLDELRITPDQAATDYDPLFSWSANVITLNRRKTVVLMCELNRYIVVLYGLKAKDFKEFGQRIVEAIRQTLLQEQVNPAVIEHYLADAGEPVFAKSKDRSQTARLSQACDTVEFIARNKEASDPVSIGIRGSQLLVGGSSGQQYFYPGEKMMDDLKRLGIEPMYKCHAFELVARLDLERSDAVRKLIVPANITFRQLHNILQAAFGWSNDHLYDFWLCERAEQEEPSIELVENDVDLEDRDGDIRLVDENQLAELLPRYKHLIYHYDFGDYWCHTIEVTREVLDYRERPPQLIAGEGNTPPEDVGGIGGYEEFLQVISNPAHEDYRYMTEWAASQGYSEFNFEQASRQVKNALLR
jgi:hypothetical protein